MDAKVKAEFESLIGLGRACQTARWLDSLPKDEKSFFEEHMFTDNVRRKALFEKIQKVYKVTFSISSLRLHLLKECGCYKTLEKSE